VVGQLVDGCVLGDVDLVVGRRRLAQQCVEVEQAGPVAAAHVIDELRGFWCEHPDALFELGQEQAFTPAHQLGQAFTGQDLATVGGVVDALDAPLGVAHLNAQPWRELLCHLMVTPVRHDCEDVLLYFLAGNFRCGRLILQCPAR
jgi:hypothetical protein